jgi:hypothetical protein
MFADVYTFLQRRCSQRIRRLPVAILLRPALRMFADVYTFLQRRCSQRIRRRPVAILLRPALRMFADVYTFLQRRPLPMFATWSSSPRCLSPSSHFCTSVQMFTLSYSVDVRNVSVVFPLLLFFVPRCECSQMFTLCYSVGRYRCSQRGRRRPVAFILRLAFRMFADVYTLLQRRPLPLFATWSSSPRCQSSSSRVSIVRRCLHFATASMFATWSSSPRCPSSSSRVSIVRRCFHFATASAVRNVVVVAPLPLSFVSRFYCSQMFSLCYCVDVRNVVVVAPLPFFVVSRFDRSQMFSLCYCVCRYRCSQRGPLLPFLFALASLMFTLCTASALATWSASSVAFLLCITFMPLPFFATCPPSSRLYYSSSRVSIFFCVFTISASVLYYHVTRVSSVLKTLRRLRPLRPRPCRDFLFRCSECWESVCVC